METVINNYQYALKAHLEAQAAYLRSARQVQITRRALSAAKIALQNYELDTLEEQERQLSTGTSTL